TSSRCSTATATKKAGTSSAAPKSCTGNSPTSGPKSAVCSTRSTSGRCGYSATASRSGTTRKAGSRCWAMPHIRCCSTSPREPPWRWKTRSCWPRTARFRAGISRARFVGTRTRATCAMRGCRRRRATTETSITLRESSARCATGSWRPGRKATRARNHPSRALPGSTTEFAFRPQRQAEAAGRLSARHAILVDGDRPPRRRAHLRAVLCAAEVVGHVVILRRSADVLRATLHVALADDRAAGPGLRPDRCAGQRTARRRRVAMMPATQLVADDSTDHRAGQRATRIDALLGNLLPLDPAALLRRSHYCADRRDRRLENALARPATIFVRRRCHRLRLVRRLAVACDRAHRRNAIVEAHLAQRLVAAAAQDHAATLEAHVIADFPATAVDDDRRGAIVETEPVEVAHPLVRRERPAAESFAFVERDLR